MFLITDKQECITNKELYLYYYYYYSSIKIFTWLKSQFTLEEAFSE